MIKGRKEKRKKRERLFGWIFFQDLSLPPLFYRSWLGHWKEKKNDRKKLVPMWVKESCGAVFFCSKKSNLPGLSAAVSERIDKQFAKKEEEGGQGKERKEWRLIRVFFLRKKESGKKTPFRAKNTATGKKFLFVANKCRLDLSLRPKKGEEKKKNYENEGNAITRHGFAWIPFSLIQKFDKFWWPILKI